MIIIAGALMVFASVSLIVKPEMILDLLMGYCKHEPDGFSVIRTYADLTHVASKREHAV